MELNKCITALTLALAGLASNAVADTISYEITFDVNSAAFCTTPPNCGSYLGYIVIDDALAKSGGSGTLTGYDFEFLQGPHFGTQYGNDRAIPFDHPIGPPQFWILHTPGFGGALTFVDGVPTAFGYGEHHDYGDKFSGRAWEMVPESANLGYTWFWQTYTSGALGTYSIGPAIPAIPEPETWALMLAGLGVVGFVKRRRA